MTFYCFSKPFYKIKTQISGYSVSKNFYICIDITRYAVLIVENRPIYTEKKKNCDGKIRNEKFMKIKVSFRS